jgi:tRNA(Ile)-lysidine synthase
VIVEQVREAVREGGRLGTDRKVVVMVSGGRDSVCLLDVAIALARSKCGSGSASVRALHVNYGLRGEASDADEQHCRALCEELGVELETVRAHRVQDAVGNLQAWAREVRYGAAIELAEREGALVAAGHTASDQVETILYRLAASPGRRALLGMPATDGRLVRPLLGITREQTGAYCLERGLRWREDESNDSPGYARARVRHGLLKALDEVHPAAQANVLRTAALLREETALLDSLVEAELKGEASIALAQLQTLETALARLVVVRLAEQVAGTYVPQAGDRVQEILALGRRGERRLDLHVGGNVSARIEDGRLRMLKLPPR